MKSLDDYIQEAEENPQDRKRIGSNVRFLRQEHDLTQSQLAKAMQDAGQEHWYQTTVSRVERGSQGLSATEVFALNKILGAEVMHGTALDTTMQVFGSNVITKGVQERLEYVEQGLAEIQRVVGELRELTGGEDNGQN